MPGLKSEALRAATETCVPAWVLLVMFLAGVAPRLAEKLLELRR